MCLAQEPQARESTAPRGLQLGTSPTPTPPCSLAASQTSPPLPGSPHCPLMCSAWRGGGCRFPSAPVAAAHSFPPGCSAPNLNGSLDPSAASWSHEAPDSPPVPPFLCSRAPSPVTGPGGSKQGLPLLYSAVSCLFSECGPSLRAPGGPVHTALLSTGHREEAFLLLLPLLSPDSSELRPTPPSSTQPPLGPLLVTEPWLFSAPRLP